MWKYDECGNGQTYAENEKKKGSAKASPHQPSDQPPIIKLNLLYINLKQLKKMYTYDTLSEAVNGLKQRGYTIDFNTDNDLVVCKKTPVSLSPNEFEITEVYRFEGNTDPADEAVVYAIESKHGHKGILVNGYGPDSNPVGDELVKKLRERH